MGRIAVVILFLGLQARGQTTFDLSADFSFQENPHKVWQYGYSATNSLAPDQFRVDAQSDRVDMQCDSTGSIGFWHPAANKGPGPNYYPYVAYNTTKQSQVGCKGWAVRAGEEGPRRADFTLNLSWVAAGCRDSGGSICESSQSAGVG